MEDNKTTEAINGVIDAINLIAIGEGPSKWKKATDTIMMDVLVPTAIKEVFDKLPKTIPQASYLLKQAWVAEIMYYGLLYLLMQPAISSISEEEKAAAMELQVQKLRESAHKFFNPE